MGAQISHDRGAQQWHGEELVRGAMELWVEFQSRGALERHALQVLVALRTRGDQRGLRAWELRDEQVVPHDALALLVRHAFPKRVCGVQ